MAPPPNRPGQEMGVRFMLNGTEHVAPSVLPTMTVLDYLRGEAGLRGTKEGCAEGDCGACTVVMVRHGGTRAEAINACLYTLGQLDGARLMTIEGLSGRDEAPDPVQQAMISSHASQCGFCTPGFVMALWALRQEGGAPDDEAIHEALAGNLCRCTGYRPIVEAARQACRNAPPDPETPDGATPAPQVSLTTGDAVWFAPVTLDGLLTLKQSHPGALLLAGGTDVGLQFSKERRHDAVTISTSHVRELRLLRETADSLHIGGAVTISEALPACERAWPALGAIMRRFGSWQIRNVATVAGNLANASPIGDLAPCLMALDAELDLAGPDGVRRMRLEEFFRAYRRTALGDAEIITRIRIPGPADGTVFRAWKISKRHDQDISAVIGAFRVVLRNGRIADMRIAFGGMAAVPARALETERALVGQTWSEDTVREAERAMERDFTPIDDQRASAAYRIRVAANLLIRLYRDVTGETAVEVNQA